LFLVAGLGNPGDQYQYNRHNVGFLVAKTLARRYSIRLKRWRNLAALGEFNLENERVILANPITFMNLSGAAVDAIASFYKIPSENIIVVHDDLDLPTGTIRLKRSGSSGGHKGVQSIIDKVGSNFLRIRIGIGRPTNKDEVIDFVLSDFEDNPEEIKITIEEAADAVIALIDSGFERATEKYNRRSKNNSATER